MVLSCTLWIVYAIISIHTFRMYYVYACCMSVNILYVHAGCMIMHIIVCIIFSILVMSTCIIYIVVPPVFVFEKEKYEVNETAGTVRIGVVKQSGNVINGQSVTLNVTPRQVSGLRSGAGVYVYSVCVCVCVCVCACMRACVRACMHVCVITIHCTKNKE